MENLSKRKFLEMLKTTVKKAEETSKKPKLEKKEKEGWEVLQNDFMLKKSSFNDIEKEDKSSSDAPSYSESEEK